MSISKKIREEMSKLCGSVCEDDGRDPREFQTDEEGLLWMMIHSGSRAMGQLITEYHLRNAVKDTPLAYLEADSDEGRAYLNDVAWAREYARQNRLSMLRMASELLRTLWSVDVDERSLIESDHNHVLQETHFGERLWVHRKGAQSAALGQPGVIPGSMGTASYHVVGRGCAESLNSASHGAGRALSRSEARSNVSVKALRRQMKGVFFDGSKAAAIRDEAPSAYKDIRRVMKAQRELVKIVRMVKPLISYKAF
jgi:tRNA-splicing ligase RtcB